METQFIQSPMVAQTIITTFFYLQNQHRTPEWLRFC